MRFNPQCNSISLPFNAKTPFGYLIALAAETATTFVTVFSFVPIISFFVGSAWLAITFIEEITNDLTELNLITKASHQNNNNNNELKERFCYIIRFYSDTKQLSAMQSEHFLIEMKIN